MQRAAIVSGVLALGSVLVFAAAALAAALFPNGGTVSTGWNAWGKDVNVGGGIAVPAPMPAIRPGVIIDEGKGGVALPDPVEDQ
jgi:hypothetical protein